MISWSRMLFPLCWFNRHAPVRERSKWNGRHYVSLCRHCGQPIHRRERGVWLGGASAPPQFNPYQFN
ncbi:hypothetical protein H7F51_16245 [Novosphingobium flavum]|uniref:Uncharacterized protein n=1 Tax=Novosphingobium flavum TaxID=1778672 RepID=A0A7X1FU72_9SPHN|nr:hypothetical protein [Novosphingobium flavum]MBC2667070.1 hypothetical protein [Novosphingobium flavum]